MNGPDLKGVMIGAGYFAQFQAEGWQRTNGAKVLAVADVDGTRAREFATRWGIPHVYTDTAEMLERERPDFADIVTRPDSHVVLTEMVARAGITVICQKPMAPTITDCEAMVQICERAGVRLIIHENWRWQAWYREIRRILDSGLTGSLFHLGSQMRAGDGRGPEPYMVQPYFRTMPRFLIYEVLVHYLDTFRFLAGDIRSIYCRTARLNPVIRAEDCAIIHVDFENGAQGLIDANRISGPFPAEPTFGTLRAEGDRGMIRLASDGRIFTTEYGHPERLHRYEVPQSGYRGDSVRAAQQHYADCLRSGKPAESEGRDYLRTVHLVEACYRSAETNASIGVGN